MSDKRQPIAVFWFRRDLRLNDNIGLNHALQSGLTVLPLFIFDTTILKLLPKEDARVTFIYDQLHRINKELQLCGSSLLVEKGDPSVIWKKVIDSYNVQQVFFNHDFEPRAIKRDSAIESFLRSNEIHVHSFKDHVFFERDEVVKDDNKPYTVFTPYKNKWLHQFKSLPKYTPVDSNKYVHRLSKWSFEFPSLETIGFVRSSIVAPAYDLGVVKKYDQTRDFPALNATSFIGHHLRFGTISIRSAVAYAHERNATFLSELIWRDFFAQILFHFPNVVDQSFKPLYDRIRWENNEDHFVRWCRGETGYPIVDAGMRQLNQTGFMHNRVRMITASFLIKHLLIDWRWGEAYFAEKLLDFDLASNNGNWQWAAGCGCDAAPYFRVFNPTIQQQKFDPEFAYCKQWIQGFDQQNYLPPIIDHAFARDRVVRRFKEAFV